MLNRRRRAPTTWRPGLRAIVALGLVGGVAMAAPGTWHRTFQALGRSALGNTNACAVAHTNVEKKSAHACEPGGHRVDENWKTCNCRGNANGFICNVELIVTCQSNQ